VEAADVPVHAAYALAGYGQMWLWMVTSVAGALAARCSARVGSAVPAHRALSSARYAPLVAAAFAGVGVLGIAGYTQQILIANADPDRRRAVSRRD